MNSLKLINCHVLLPFICIILCIVIYKCRNNEWYDSSSNYINTQENYNFINFYSSVICRGNNHTNRVCHFKNLCYDPNSHNYLFFYNYKSIRSGLPNDRFSPTLIDFSSVYDHNTQYFNFVDLPDTALTFFNLSYNKGNYLMFKRFNPENLMHVFHDDLLPVFSTIMEINSNIEPENIKISLIFADNRSPGPYQMLYDNFLIKMPFYINSLSTQYLHCFQSVHVGLNKHSTWYHYGFKEPQGPLIKPHREIAPIIISFREYFLKKYSINLNGTQNCAILLTRNQNRKILNEIEVKQTITDLTGLETIIMNLEQYTVYEIISKIISCKLIVGMHGSLLVLSLFMNPFSVLLELFPFGVPPNISTPYKTLVSISGLNLIYNEWLNRFENNSVPHPEYSPEHGGIFHLSYKERLRIKNSFVKPFLCCDDHVWLYRIYQDTLVDTNSFRTILLEAMEKSAALQSKDEKHNYELYPSEIEDYSCNISHTNSSMVILWTQPWNVVFMYPSKIEYEIWIQIVRTGDVQAFITTKHYFTYNLDTLQELYYVWIRCYIDGLIGPFNSMPLVCP